MVLFSQRAKRSGFKRIHSGRVSFVRLRLWGGLLLFLLLLGGAAVLIWRSGLLEPKKYTATASLLIARSEPHIFSALQEKSDPAEFDTFRENQRSLLTHDFVLSAALRNPKVKNLPSIAREDSRHNALTWLTEIVHAEFSAKNAGVLDVSVTLPDGGEAAAIVNAVIEAYRQEVVGRDRQQRRERIDSLQRIAGEKEHEVRNKRELFNRELAESGSGESSSALRAQLAFSIYTEYLRELQRMRWERTALSGRLEAAIKMRDAAANMEIPEVEVAALLNNDPTYRELRTRLAALESKMRRARATKSDHSPEFDQDEAEFGATRNQAEEMIDHAREQVRATKRIAMDQEIHTLTTELEISTEQVNELQKQVDSKQREADAMGDTSVAVQTDRPSLESLERMLRSVNEEREILRVETNAPPRVRVLGDESSPAVVRDAN